MARAVIDISGQKYGRYTVIKRDGSNKSGNATWLCQCDCGVYKVVAAGALRSGETKSCGCWIRDVTSERSITHGNSKTRLYKIWIGMKSRCYNPKTNNYKDYGGRGIYICDLWKDYFESFMEWSLAHGYQSNYSIDRINNDGPYAPNNCQWITKFDQQSNKRSNRLIEIDGIVNTVAEWGRVYGIDPQAIWGRINRGWDDSLAVTTPSDKRRKRKGQKL